MRVYNSAHHSKSENYLVLMVGFLGLIIFPALALILPVDSSLVFNLIYSVVILISIYTVTTKIQELAFGSLFGLIILTSFWLRNTAGLEIQSLSIVEILLSSAFFIYLANRILKQLVARRIVDVKTIYGSLLGYLVLGAVGGQICILLELSFPGSYRMVDVAHGQYSFYYYSFVTLTTLGYGDIIPITDASRSLSVLLSIIGQFYMAILMAIIVGKYISNAQD